MSQHVPKTLCAFQALDVPVSNQESRKDRGKSSRKHGITASVVPCICYDHNNFVVRTLNEFQMSTRMIQHSGGNLTYMIITSSVQRHFTLLCAQTHRSWLNVAAAPYSCLTHVQYYVCVTTLLHDEWTVCFKFVTQPEEIPPKHPHLRLCVSCSITHSVVCSLHHC